MSYRLMQKFWLDISKPDERDLAQEIVALKAQRAFTSTIRDALSLFMDLKRGRIDVLLALFPWVKEALQPTPAATSDARLQEQIARLEALLIAQGNVPIQSTAERAQRRSAQKSRAVVEVTASKASAETVAKNFLTSMKSLASGFFD